VRGLTGPEIGTLVSLVDDLFDPDELDMLLRIRLDKKFRNLHRGGTYNKQVFDAVLKANAQGWVPRLLQAMIADRPENAELRSFAATVGTIAPNVFRKDLTDKAPEGFLEKFVKAGNLVRWTDFTENLGPDLILTNHHVVAPILDADPGVTDVHFRFDYATPDPELSYHLPADEVNIIAHRPPADPATATEQAALTAGRPAEALDYALIRLPKRLGDEPFGPQHGPGINLPPRGHLMAPFDFAQGPPATAPRLRPDADIFIAQHPNGRSLRIGVGQVLDVAPDGSRFRYNTNTDSGSSGAPCFNAKLQWVGIHHYGSEEGGFNQGIPLAVILEDLAAQGISLT